MTKLQSTSLVKLVKSEIERRIYAGELQDGERIFINRVTRELGVSAVPLHEALARLHAQRLVKFEPNRGYAVLPPPNAEEMAELLDVRLALEAGALELIKFPVSPEDLAPPTKINHEIATTAFENSEDRYREFEQLNRKFHTHILGLCHNAGLLRRYENLGYQQLFGRVVATKWLSYITMIVDQHEKIIETLQFNARSKARRMLVEHILQGQNALSVPKSSCRKLAASAVFRAEKTLRRNRPGYGRRP